MGLISDALKRAEEERRQKAQSAPVNAPHDHVEPVAPNELVDVPPGLQPGLGEGGNATDPTINTPEEAQIAAGVASTVSVTSTMSPTA